MERIGADCSTWREGTSMPTQKTSLSFGLGRQTVSPVRTIRMIRPIRSDPHPVVLVLPDPNGPRGETTVAGTGLM